ncbi:MAG: flagellar biosynthetic protein FliR [Myxococcota bacterium]|jgi:flagellar biosynthetic protein FliR|nr:flagellar biosynthetic protein FliR [Myxococcota bacterium]MEC9439554.1 flagellar biosynthetic protein FliR [Myxococcota bacterium]
MFDLFTDPATQALLDRAILLWALVAARIAPIVMMVPYLGGKAVPQLVKMGLTIALTGMIYPLVWGSGAAAALPDGALALSVLLLKELLLGFTFGFVAALVFDAVRIAGQLIDNARGQTQATAFVPQLKERVSVTGDYLYQLNVVVFLLLGGHRLFIAALVNSFAAIPPQTMPPLGDHLGAMAFGITRLATDAITLGVVMAFPVIAAILLTDLCLAMVNRAAPQINVFFLGMPIKALAGIAVVLITLQALVERTMREAVSGIQFIEAIMQSLAMGG